MSTRSVPGTGVPGSDRPRRSGSPRRPRQVRQGDVLLIPVEALPPDARALRRAGRLVVALGEATGHAHAVLERDAREARTPSGERFLRLPTTARLVHEEHAAIDLAAGLYRIVIQREYQPVTRHGAAGPAWRRVAD